MKLFETSVGEDIECPFCNFFPAYFEHETRADFEDEDYPGWPFDKYSFCPLCGWIQYEMEDEDIWFEIAADKGVNLEDQDEVERALPPNPLEYEPKAEDLKLAKEIMNKIIDRAPDNADDMLAHFVYEDWSNFETQNLGMFRKGFVLYLFNELK
jgi:hypothetical protein